MPEPALGGDFRFKTCGIIRLLRTYQSRHGVFALKRLIFGCGFLGWPLAKAWQLGGDEVFAVTRKPGRAAEFEQHNLLPIVADITDQNSIGELPEVDTVVIAVGMDRSMYKNVHDVYVQGLENILRQLHPKTGQLIYVSSTGVYGNFNGDWVDEDSPTDPKREGGKACLAAEEVLRSCEFADRATVLRMAGLYGNERVPTRKVIEAKQWDKLSANGYLNLIHVADAVSAIQIVAQQEIKNELFLVSDSHPSLRRDYYQFIADCFGMPEIPWNLTATPDPESRSSASKRIRNTKLLAQTGLELRFPDYRSGLSDAFTDR